MYVPTSLPFQSKAIHFPYSVNVSGVCVLFSAVKAGPPNPVLMHCACLHLWLEQISSSLYLQMVHASGIHAVSDCAIFGVGVQGAAASSVRGPHPHPHSTRLGENPAQGRDGWGQSHQPVNSQHYIYTRFTDSWGFHSLMIFMERYIRWI